MPVRGAKDGRNFGHRRVFNGQPRAPHSGADLRATTGTPIYAANRGRVVLAKDLFFSGNAVFIDHGYGLFTTYLHLSQIDVAVGEMVEQGQQLGLAGATGRVTGAHLHWGVRLVDARVDPFSLIASGPVAEAVSNDRCTCGSGKSPSTTAPRRTFSASDALGCLELTAREERRGPADGALLFSRLTARRAFC